MKSMRWVHCVVFVFVLFIGCGLRDEEVKATDFDQVALKMIEGKVGFQLPTGTKGIRMLKREAIDPAFVAILEIPKASQESIAQELAKKPEIKFSGTNYLIANLPWWKPEEKKTVAQRSYMNKNDLIEVRLCSDSERLIMYIECSLAM
jgi:hypothetical protein